MTQIHVIAPDVEAEPTYRAFDEILLTLVGGLERLGCDVLVSHQYVDLAIPTIVLAPHTLPMSLFRRLPATTILYNWEQLGGTTLMSPERQLAFRNFIVWDYSEKNTRYWQQHGATNVIHVPLGYDPKLEMLPATGEPPRYDVMFYGALNPRRQQIIQRMRERGLTVAALRLGFGEERNTALLQSRLVLNVHYYDTGILEQARMSLLWANRRPVLSEANPNTEIPFHMGGHALLAPYGSLVEAAVDALADQTALDRAANDAYEWFRVQGDASRLLAQALEQTLELSETKVRS